jgi:hypothetical protein
MFQGFWNVFENFSCVVLGQVNVLGTFGNPDLYVAGKYVAGKVLSTAKIK